MILACSRKEIPSCLNSESSFKLTRKPIYYNGLHLPSYNRKRAERRRDSTGPLTNLMQLSFSDLLTPGRGGTLGYELVPFLREVVVGRCRAHPASLEAGPGVMLRSSRVEPGASALGLPRGGGQVRTPLQERGWLAGNGGKRENQRGTFVCHPSRMCTSVGGN